METISNAVLLRKLTEKSKLKFGEYADLTVGDLLKIGKKKYLRWCYYHCSMITFIDEILDILSIRDDFLIEKPGKNIELFEKHTELINGFTPGLMKKINKMHSSKVFKAKNKGRIKRENRYFSKGSLQARNQGH